MNKTIMEQNKMQIQKLSSYPIDGKYGKFGGRFVPEVLMEAAKTEPA